MKRKAQVVLMFLLAVTVCDRASALHSTVRQVRHRRQSVRSVLYHPMFRPTHESMLRQNEEVDRLELPRIQDEAELDELKANGSLLPIRASESLRFSPGLAANRRFCRPWTRDFVEDLGQAFYQQFHASIQVNSAVRTMEQQKKLRRHNRNAAPESGETASSHLAGITVDIQRRGLTGEQIRWIEEYMLPLNAQGLIEPEEERHQWVFHVMVSDRYSNWRDLGNGVVEAHKDAAPAPVTVEPKSVSVVAPEQQLPMPGFFLP